MASKTAMGAAIAPIEPGMDLALDRLMRQYNSLVTEQSEQSVRAFSVSDILPELSRRLDDFDIRFRRPASGIVPPAPTKRDIEPISLPGCDAEYRALAKSLGIFNAEMIDAELQQFLAENLIRVYPLESVTAYMNALCAENDEKRGGWWGRTTWDWYPLRAVDVDPPTGGTSGPRNRQYRKPVPMPVLETVKLIGDRFQDAVRFCVTDTEVKDPFLCVGAKTDDEGGVHKIYVIERWDEPKYRP